MAQYRKKLVVIDAIQFLGFSKENGQVELSERPDWLISEFGRKILFFDKPNTLTVKTLEGNMNVSIGDFIIKGVNSEFYPCKPDIFGKTYEKVDCSINPDYLKLAQIAYNTVLQTMIEGEKEHGDEWKSKSISYHKRHALEHAEKAYTGVPSKEDDVGNGMTRDAIIKYLEAGT